MSTTGIFFNISSYENKKELKMKYIINRDKDNDQYLQKVEMELCIIEDNNSDI